MAMWRTARNAPATGCGSRCAECNSNAAAETAFDQAQTAAQSAGSSEADALAAAMAAALEQGASCTTCATDPPYGTFTVSGVDCDLSCNNGYEATGSSTCSGQYFDAVPTFACTRIAPRAQSVAVYLCALREHTRGHANMRLQPPHVRLRTCVHHAFVPCAIHHLCVCVCQKYSAHARSLWGDIKSTKPN